MIVNKSKNSQDIEMSVPEALDLAQKLMTAVAHALQYEQKTITQSVIFVDKNLPGNDKSMGGIMYFCVSKNPLE